MCEYQDYYEDFKTAYWRDEDPEKCKCRGNGWALSEVDTWHQCPIHYVGQEHPNVESEEYGFYDPDGVNCTAFHPGDVCLSMATWHRRLRLAIADLGDDDIPF